MEKFPLMNTRLYLRSPSINVCFRVIIEGTICENNLAKALKAVCIRHPFLNSFVELDNNNAAWLIKRNIPFSVEYYKSNEMDWQTWYKRNDDAVFDFSQGPLVKFCVITDNNTEIIILGHHIIGDGVGYLNLIKDILLSLDDRMEVAPQIPPFQAPDTYFKETILLDEGVRSYATSLNEKWKLNRVRFSENDYVDFFKAYRKKFVPNLYMTSIAGDNFLNLLKKAKSSGLTVNEIIAVAFSVSTKEILEIDEIRLGIALNIRNELVSEPKECMGNYSSGISVKTHYDPKLDFITNAKKIAETIQEQLSNVKARHLAVHFLNEFEKDLIESIVFAAYSTFDHSVSKKLAELIGERTENKGIGISNLGRFENINYSNFEIVDLYFIGPAFPANLITVDVITIRDKLNLCIRYNEEELNIDTVKLISKKAIGFLI